MVVSDEVDRLADRLVVVEAQQPALPLEVPGMPGTIEEARGIRVYSISWWATMIPNRASSKPFKVFMFSYFP